MMIDFGQVIDSSYGQVQIILHYIKDEFVFVQCIINEDFTA